MENNQINLICGCCNQSHSDLKFKNCHNCSEDTCVLCLKYCHFCHKSYCISCVEDCENNGYTLISQKEKTRYKIYMGGMTRITDDIENYSDKYHYSTIVYTYYLCHECKIN